MLAWVMGAADPTSGTVSLREVTRGFGALLKSGWRPLRNIVIASWDAEEYGLIGSTEFAEDFPEWISENVVAYVNPCFIRFKRISTVSNETKKTPRTAMHKVIWHAQARRRLYTAKSR